MIGIVGYAVPCPSGITVRALREALSIEHQFTIYSYTHGGWDNRWAENTFLNGAPQDGNMKGRWSWEVQRGNLEYWIKTNGITHVVFVGGTFGEKSAEWAKEFGSKTALVEVYDGSAAQDQFLSLDFRVGGQHDAASIAEFIRQWVAMDSANKLRD